jgi:hypothetical protein
MSRRTFAIDEERYAVVGWNRPLNSYFWQVYNGADEQRICELERNSPEDEELDALYAKYEQSGGEPIIADSGLGDPRKRINNVVELQQSMKEYAVIPATVSAERSIFA